MPFNDVQIANFALFRIKVSKQITSLTEQSPEAIACNLWFTHAREAVLSDAEWPFATKRGLLALVTLTDAEMPDEWGFAYAYPTDCIYARIMWDGAQKRRPEQELEFRIEHHPNSDARIIYSDVEDACLIYTKDVTNAGLFSEHFVDALAWRLAADIAPSLMASRESALDALRMYRFVLGDAIAHELNEERFGREIESELIATREGAG